MKKLRYSGLLLATLMVSSAYADSTITVTTEVDENGSNPGACSLREALHVANDKGKKAWGGCPAASNVGDITIQLDALTYTLDLGALQVLGSVIIAGKDTVVADDEATAGVDESIDPYTGKAPKRIRPVTIIDGLNQDRIIDSYGATGTSLTLRDLVLRNGRADYARYQGNGGAIYAALSLALDNTRIENSRAEGLAGSSSYLGGMGGAIYLSKSGAGIAMSNGTLQGNVAEGGGGAIAMVCEEDLALAGHAVSITTSLLKSNSAARGAGGVQACGLSTLTVANSTMAMNASMTGSGVLSFLPTREGQGSVSLSNVTIAQSTGGAALAFGKISAVRIDSSALLGNAGNCILATGTSFPNGNYNAVDDNTCNDLLVPLSSATDANQRLVASWTNELLPLADHGGVTEVYLPVATSTKVLDKGMALGSCGNDQRGFARQSGSACDIGAAERQTASANEDSADSGSNFGRVAIIDVLDNDAFGEGDGTGSNGYNRYANFAQDGEYAVKFDNDAAGKCKWYDKNDTTVDEEYRNRVVIDNNRVITADGSPVSCTYRVRVIPNGGGAPQLSASAAAVSANIRNVSPKAVADVYVRPVGTVSLSMDLVLNDTDVDDSNGGLSTPLEVVDINGDPVNKYALVYINKKPDLGTIVGTSKPCPDNSASSVKNCYQMPLSYVAKNPQSPFEDSFQYSVYDEDDAPSAVATVTIKTDAPDPDKGETGGSLDLAGMLLLSLLGLRAARKL